MARCKVVIESTAEADLRGILRYITATLKEPATARRVYGSIKATIMKLDTFPLRNRLVQDEPFRSQGIRTMIAENYLIFYTVDETENTVHILRVLHGRREWRNLL